MIQKNTNRQKKSKLPDFNLMTWEEEAQWWDTHDITDYLDELEPANVKFDLKKPKEETVVLRLHKGVKHSLVQLARTKGLNISSLLRMWVMEKLQTNHRA